MHRTEVLTRRSRNQKVRLVLVLERTGKLRTRIELPILSVDTLNTAEGNGRRQGRQRAKFFDDARGSAIECAACLDASVAKGFTPLDRIQAGKEMLVRIVAMLTKLLMRFDPEQYRVHESAAGLAAPFEHEHDDEHEDEIWLRLRVHRALRAMILLAGFGFDLVFMSSGELSMASAAKDGLIRSTLQASFKRPRVLLA